MSWAEGYRAALSARGRTWADDVVTETAVCECHPGRTWLRHVPTGVLIHHDGRGHAETLAHLADLLGQHQVITEDDRRQAHAKVTPA